jgi:hypothetical protein
VLLVVGAWMARSDRRGAGTLVLTGTAGMAGLAVAIEVASHGNFSATFQELLLGGGDAGYALGAPMRFASELFYYHPDLGLLFLVALAWAAMAWWREGADPASEARLLVHGFLGTTSVMGLVLLASEGTNYNQLVDMQISCILTMGLHVHRGCAPGAPAVFAAWALGLLATLLPGVPSEFKTIEAHEMTSRQGLRDLHREFLGSGPYLAWNGLVPLVNGDRPFILDKYNLHIFQERDHPAARMVARGVAESRFSAIVVNAWDGVRDDLDREDPELVRRGPSFMRECDPLIPGPAEDRYQLVAIRSGFAILVPRSGGSQP